MEYLLALFFFKIGLELRFELTNGVLVDRKFLGVAALSAFLGMIFPVSLFFILTSIFNVAHVGWGTIMATDLPLVLALLAIVKQNKLRPFILALATLDDIGSIIVLSFIHQNTMRWPYMLLFIALFLGYSFFSRYSQSVILLIILFGVAIIFGNKAGFPVSLSAVLLGIFTIGNSANGTSIERKLLHLLEPVSAYLVIPIFMFVTLFRKLELGTTLFSGGLVATLIIARLLGKPLGVSAGISIGQRLLKTRSSLTSQEGWLIGLLATLGLSVSLIFAQGQLAGDQLNKGILAILLTIPLGVLTTVLYVRKRRKRNSELKAES